MGSNGLGPKRFLGVTKCRIDERRLRLGKRREKKVDIWLKEVHMIKGDVQKIEQEVVEGRNYISRARLGKLVVEKLQEVVELQEKGKFSDGLLVNALPTIWQIPTAPVGRGATVERNMGKIWECLMNDKVKKIGVFGMGGVGKTTIMHHINNQLMGMTGKFDNMIWVTFSKAFTIVRLQNEIAASLNLDLSDYEDETRRASKVYAMLTQMKRYVLILDDLWEAFPLEKVGLPEPTRMNGCRLVLTTRSLKVCTKMECRPIKVELLSEEEALDLFMSKVAPQFAIPPEVLEIADLVVRKCAGLPLAIVTVAGSMKGVEDIHEWRYASREIANWTEGTSDMENELFERLKFSYSGLKDETLQRCFLYCALYPEDHKIPRQELIGYWIAEGLITECIGEQAATDKGHTILNKLENTCILEGYTNCSGEKWVKVHDVIREMALNITKVSPLFMVQAGLGLTESLSEVGHGILKEFL